MGFLYSYLLQLFIILVTASLLESQELGFEQSSIQRALVYGVLGQLCFFQVFSYTNFIYWVIMISASISPFPLMFKYLFQIKTPTFSTRALILVHTNFVSQYDQKIKITLKQPIDTIHYLNCVMDQVFSKQLLWLLVKIKLQFYIQGFYWFLQ